MMLSRMCLVSGGSSTNCSVTRSSYRLNFMLVLFSSMDHTLQKSKTAFCTILVQNNSRPNAFSDSMGITSRFTAM